ncbi:phage tail tape measure protein [Moraxella osloensis]|uniref:Phage tail tape measure protein n=1 Tax=Faucicola osloensis TaxID=34062 RepID=A0A2I1RIZ6_FAUOS|nr:phage tail tape measure protein [Moraxella osloensis]PKZ69078.1 phage tail tape measure protein [Moraxella osloensis]
MANLTLQATVELIDRMTAPLQSMSSQADRLTQAFRQTNGEMRSLQNQQRLISAFHSQSAAVRQTQTEFSQAHARLATLRQQMQATANPSQTLVRNFQQAERTVERLNQRLQSQNQTLTQTRDRLQSLGMNTSNLAADEQRLAQAINRTNTELEQRRRRMEQVQQIQERYHRQQEKLQNIRNTSTAVAVGGAVALALPIKEYAQAEDAAMGLKVSMMDATGKVAPEFEKINALAERLGTSLPGSTAEFSGMMAKLVQQGISFKDILGGVGEASANLAVVMKMPFADAAEFAAKMQDATKTSAKDMTALMDVIQKSYYLGVDSTNMLTGFAKLSAGMKTIKQEGLAGAKAMAPLLVMADQAAMSGESAGNAYSKIFKAMMDTQKISKTLKGSGLSMNFTDGKGEFGGLDNMFKQLEKLKGMSTESRLPILADMFGNDAETIQALNLLIDKGKAGYDETIAKMEKQAALQQRVNAQLSTLTNLWDSAKGTFSSVMASFGEALAPDIKNLVEWMTGITEKIGAWAKANPELATTIMRVLAGIVALAAVMAVLATAALTIIGPIALLRTAMVTIGGMGGMLNMILAPLRMMWSLFGFVGQAVFSAVGLIGRALWSIVPVIRAVGMAMMANPILIVVAAIAAAALYIWMNWGTLGPKFAALWAWITSGARTMWASIVATWNSLVASVIGYANSLWSGLGIRFSSGVAALLGIIAAFSPVGLFIRAFAAVLSYFAGLGAQFAAYGGHMIDGLRNGIMSRLGGVLSSIQSVAGRIKSAFTSAMSIHSPSRVFMSYGGHLMTGLANGITGNANLPLSATTALAGQISDQAPLGFDTRATVLPSRGMGGNSMAMGYASGSGITININGASDPQAVAREVERVLNQRDRNLQARNRSRLADID